MITAMVNLVLLEQNASTGILIGLHEVYIFGDDNIPIIGTV